MPAAYPFAAIVGQDAVKRALLAAAVDPGLGGVLALGDRGTGKSTAVRALASLLPPMAVVRGCPYNAEQPEACSRACPVCGADGASGARQVSAPAGGARPGPATGTKARSKRPAAEPSKQGDAPQPPGQAADGRNRGAFVLVPVPVVDLPLGATEDRVAGALDIERALSRGEKAFEPGLLAKANRGFLYVDEVNLLEDHLVDLLLDVAASGVNLVEREGLSVRHPARFVLIGSGNPEEGELRPQLLDRFGLSVEVTTPKDVPSRVEVIKRREAFERDPDAFARAWEPEQEALRAGVLAARGRLAAIEVPDGALERAATLCLALGTDGLRGELSLIRAARALTALDGGAAVGDEALRRAAPLALPHRLRRDPLDEAGGGARVARAVAELFGEGERAEPPAPHQALRAV